MLFLLFQLGDDRYALEARHVVEVVPLLALKDLPQAPRGVAGLFNYRGHPVLAVDLSDLTQRGPSRQRLSTRIILVRYPMPEGQARLLGLIAENATEMLRCDPKEFMDAGLHLPDAPYLGGVLMDNHGPIQRIETGRLLPDAVRSLLLADPQALTYAPA
jgi:chemotaxis-related protein WspB